MRRLCLVLLVVGFIGGCCEPFGNPTFVPPEELEPLGSRDGYLWFKYTTVALSGGGANSPDNPDYSMPKRQRKLLVKQLEASGYQGDFEIVDQKPMMVNRNIYCECTWQVFYTIRVPDVD